MKLHLIYRKKTNTRTLAMFHKAAAELNVEIVEIISNDFDFSDQQIISGNDAIYCLSDDAHSQLVAKSIIGPESRTFYKDYKTAITKIDDADDITSYLIHKMNGLPVIPSIPGMTKNKNLLLKYVQSLGGFPIVIKALGGSKGRGTMRVDSMESLNSIDDYLLGTRDRFIVKKYITEARSIRAVVLGEEVIAAIKHEAINGDFRSNSGKGDHHAESYKVSQLERKIAVAAVNTLGFQFGGVDLSVDPEGNTYITEVNMPCAFIATVKATEVDIAQKMILHLRDQ